MDVSLVDEINSFALTISDPRLVALLTDLCQRVEALDRDNKELKTRIIELELQQDDHTAAINRHAEAINQVWSIMKRPSVPKGQKTKARLEDLDKILRARGAKTLSQLEMDLKISPQQMSGLISKLDMKRYNLFFREGNGREKVLMLRSRII
jgi:Fe-S-cluster formation regulator IscX/YfhJ